MGSIVFEGEGSIGQAYAYDTKHYPALNLDVMYLGFKPASDLLDSIRMVSHAMSEDEARPQLNGVFLSNRTGVIQVAATDGHRASVAGFDKNLGISKSVLLSSGSVERLLAFKGVTGVGYAGDVRGDVASPTFEVTTKKGVRYTVHSRPLDMEYPDYTRVFPTTHIDWYLEIRDTNRLKQQLKAAIKALKANESRYFVGRINITQDKATIHTEVGDFDLGKVVGTTDKPSLQTGLNIIYLLDVLDTAPVVEIQVREGLDPLVFYYKKENSYEVIMPVRV
jgi:DNA polymerase III sliding clamp (beta) subunit (PCNA family)